MSPHDDAPAAPSSGSRSILPALFSALTILLLPATAAGQSALDHVDNTRGVIPPNEAGIVRAEIIHTIEKYYEYFSTGQMDRIPQETHHVPWVFLGTGVFTNTAEETASNYVARRQMVVDELDSDYQTSTYTVTGLCLLSRNAGITSGYNTRTNSTGGIVSVEGVSYIVMKAPQGWRIVAFSEITPEKVISC
jgi:hypothetical protein